MSYENVSWRRGQWPTALDGGSGLSGREAASFGERLPTLHRNCREHTTKEPASVFSFGTKMRLTDPTGGWRRCRASNKTAPSVHLSINTLLAKHQTDNQISQITQFYQELCWPLKSYLVHSHKCNRQFSRTPTTHFHEQLHSAPHFRLPPRCSRSLHFVQPNAGGKAQRICVFWWIRHRVTRNCMQYQLDVTSFRNKFQHNTRHAIPWGCAAETSLNIANI